VSEKNINCPPKKIKGTKARLCAAAALLLTTVRLGDVAVFENRLPEPLLTEVTKVDVIFFSLALFFSRN
jgi:hypothetical protein